MDRKQTGDVMPSQVTTDDRWDQALASIQVTIDKIKHCSEEEKQRLRDDLRDLLMMQDKLTRGQVDVVVFGEISTGKSALINALVGNQVREVNVQGGWTKEVWDVAWDAVSYTMPGFADSRVVLVDTPGLNEIGGAERAEIARQAAQRSDLILFVTDSDLNHIEFSALLELASAHKPILLVFNKTDNFSPEDRERLREVLRDERLQGVIDPEDVVLTSADPRKVQIVIESVDGTNRSEWRKPPPDVEQLKVRILEILEREGLALLALNVAMYAADKSDRIGALRVRMRNETANHVIWRYAVLKGVGVALNPAPYLDTASGFAIDATMIVHLAKVYGLTMTRAHAGTLVKTIAQSAGMVGLGEISFHLLCGTLKAITFGHALAFTMLPQGGLAAFSSYIVGNAAKCYFEQGASWGSSGVKKTVTNILENTDKNSIMNKFKEEIKKKLQYNPHASGAVSGD